MSSFINNWFELPYYNIGERAGFTEYIDFITEHEITQNVMKGNDIFGRDFIVVKATITDNENNKYHVFETFFQRYSKDEILFMGCGHYGNKFMDTTGGMTVNQKKLLNNLIQNEKVLIDDSVIQIMRIPSKLSENDAKFVSIELGYN